MAASLPNPESRKMTASRMRPSRMVVELLEALLAPAAEVLMDMATLRIGLNGHEIEHADCSPKPHIQRHIVHSMYISVIGRRTRNSCRISCRPQQIFPPPNFSSRMRHVLGPHQPVIVSRADQSGRQRFLAQGGAVLVRGLGDLGGIVVADCGRKCRYQ